METSDVCLKMLEKQMNDAKVLMEEKRDELNRVVREIKGDPARSIESDPEAWEINMELSRAIQDFLRLEKQVMRDKSEY